MVFQYLIGAVAAVTLGAYMCRVLMLDPRLHTWPPIIMHSGLAAAMGVDMVAAYQGDAGPGHIATLIGAVAWIAISYPSWRLGVPQHYWRAA